MGIFSKAYLEQNYGYMNIPEISIESIYEDCMVLNQLCYESAMNLYSPVYLTEAGSGLFSRIKDMVSKFIGFIRKWINKIGEICKKGINFIRQKIAELKNRNNKKKNNNDASSEPNEKETSNTAKKEEPKPQEKETSNTAKKEEPKQIEKQTRVIEDYDYPTAVDELAEKVEILFDLSYFSVAFTYDEENPSYITHSMTMYKDRYKKVTGKSTQDRELPPITNDEALIYFRGDRKRRFKQGSVDTITMNSKISEMTSLYNKIHDNSVKKGNECIAKLEKWMKEAEADVKQYEKETNGMSKDELRQYHRSHTNDDGYYEYNGNEYDAKNLSIYYSGMSKMLKITQAVLAFNTIIISAFSETTIKALAFSLSVM